MQKKKPCKNCNDLQNTIRPVAATDNHQIKKRRKGRSLLESFIADSMFNIWCLTYPDLVTIGQWNDLVELARQKVVLRMFRLKRGLGARYNNVSKATILAEELKTPKMRLHKQCKEAPKGEGRLAKCNNTLRCKNNKEKMGWDIYLSHDDASAREPSPTRTTYMTHLLIKFFNKLFFERMCSWLGANNITGLKYVPEENTVQFNLAKIYYARTILQKTVRAFLQEFPKVEPPQQGNEMTLYEKTIRPAFVNFWTSTDRDIILDAEIAVDTCGPDAYDYFKDIFSSNNEIDALFITYNTEIPVWHEINLKYSADQCKTLFDAYKALYEGLDKYSNDNLSPLVQNEVIIRKNLVSAQMDSLLKHSCCLREETQFDNRADLDNIPKGKPLPARAPKKTKSQRAQSGKPSSQRAPTAPSKQLKLARRPPDESTITRLRELIGQAKTLIATRTKAIEEKPNDPRVNEWRESLKVLNYWLPIYQRDLTEAEQKYKKEEELFLQHNAGDLPLEYQSPPTAEEAEEQKQLQKQLQNNEANKKKYSRTLEEVQRAIAQLDSIDSRPLNDNEQSYRKMLTDYQKQIQNFLTELNWANPKPKVPDEFNLNFDTFVSQKKPPSKPLTPPSTDTTQQLEEEVAAELDRELGPQPPPPVTGGRIFKRQAASPAAHLPTRAVTTPCAPADLAPAFLEQLVIRGQLGGSDSASANGFVYELSTPGSGANRTKYVLKSSKKPSADNLVYEYFTGQYINCVIDRLQFPCFIRTYGLLKYKTDAGWLLAANSPDKVSGETLKSLMDVQTKSFDFQSCCTEPTHIATVIEFLEGESLGKTWAMLNVTKKAKGSTTVETDKSNSPEVIAKMLYFTEHDLLSILLQIYIPLMILKDEFTHYDLHTNNIVLQPAVNVNGSRYKTFSYAHDAINGSRTTTFRSKYTAKIIDYGRSFFQDPSNPKLGSRYVYKKVCEVQTCNTQQTGICGTRIGFNWLANPNGKFTANNDYFINSSRSNISHDLRLMRMLLTKLQYLKNVIVEKNEQLKFPVTLALHACAARETYSGVFGTPPVESKHTGNSLNAPILNVTDLVVALLAILSTTSH
jgi:hypothetical protein